jgi:signal peptidase I
MTSLASDSDSPLPAAQLDSSPKSRTKRVILAGLLSLFLPGMGQLFNRQPRKAFVFAIITHISGATVAHTRLLLSFWTMVASVIVLMAWQVFSSAEAANAAALAKKPERPIPLPWLTYPLLAIIIIFSALAPSPPHTMYESGFHVSRISSASMCPTICSGDRIVADAWAYRLKSPQRGDLILLKHSSQEALFIKRVIALPGDLVEPGPDGTILVNGQTFHPPASCGKPVWVKETALRSIFNFQSTKVPDGALFVVGDNLDQSLDSRIPDFGAVTPDMVRGKPLYFIWSSTPGRMACPIY